MTEKKAKIKGQLAKLALEQKERSEKIKKFNDEMKAAETAKDFKKALDILEQRMLLPHGFENIAVKKYALLEQFDVKKAHAFALQAMKTYEYDPLTLQALVASITTDYKLALKLMEVAANKSDSEDPYAVANLAKAYYKAGDVKKAIATQQRVIDILNDTSLVEQKQSVKDSAIETLAIYKSGGKLPNS